MIEREPWPQENLPEEFGSVDRSSIAGLLAAVLQRSFSLMGKEPDPQ